MFCPGCGEKIQQGDNYCRGCGAPVGAAGTGQQVSAGTKLGIVILLVALVGIVVLVTSMRGTKTISTAEETAHNHQVPEVTNPHPMLAEVASQYICPCGNCVDNLWTCDCGHVGGSYDTKKFINDHLHKGLGKEEINAEMQKRYGANLKYDTNVRGAK